MKTYITKFQLFDFQSWNDTADSIDLEPNMINIIEGKNETGKSVLYKVLYNFAFPGYWNANELIRRGADVGIMALYLSNGHTILYSLKRKSHSYALISSDDKIQKWENCALPKEIIQELGLILDYESKVILNVIDKDVALPFIKTSPKFNASLIRSIIEPPDITEYFQRVQDTLADVQVAKANYKTKTIALQSALNALPLADINELEQQKYKVDILCGLVTRYSDYCSILLELQDILQKPIRLCNNPGDITEAINLIDAIEALIDNVKNMWGVTNYKINVVNPPSDMHESMKCVDSIVSVLADIENLSVLMQTEPKTVNLPDITHCLSLESEIKNLCSLISSCQTIVHSLAEVDQKIHQTYSEILRIQKEVGVCPTCGRLFDIQEHS